MMTICLMGLGLLAQAAPGALPDPTHWSTLGWLLVALGGLAAALNQGSAFFDRFTGRANRRTVDLASEPASRSEFERQMAVNMQEHRDMFAKIGGVERGSQKKISDEIGVMHTRVNALEKSVGGLEASAQLTNQRLMQIDGKLDRLIERRECGGERNPKLMA